MKYPTKRVNLELGGKGKRIKCAFLQGEFPPHNSRQSGGGAINCRWRGVFGSVDGRTFRMESVRARFRRRLGAGIRMEHPRRCVVGRF